MLASPVSSPSLKYFTRCFDVPWLNFSGFAPHPASLSSPIALADVIAVSVEHDDPDLAARQLISLVNMDLKPLAMMGQRPTEAEVDAATRAAVRTFLRAYGRKATGPAATT